MSASAVRVVAHPIPSTSRKLWLGVLVAACTCCLSADETAPVGWRSDGTGFFPEAAAPVAFNVATGSNVLWQTPLPNWGSGAPVVAGGKVFVVCEATWEQVAPTINCFDADSGAPLWSAQIDHTALLPGEQRQQVVADWLRLRAWEGTARSLMSEWRRAEGDNAKRAVLEKLKAHGAEEKELPKMERHGMRGLRWDRQMARTANMLRKDHSLYFSLWYQWGQHVGNGMPTPVTDGEHVWVWTGHGTAGCYTADGRLVWLKNFNQWDQGESVARETADTYYISSPLKVGNVLVILGGMAIRGLDATTGELKWQHYLSREGHKCLKAGNPVALRFGATDVVMTPPGLAFRVSDGKPLRVEPTGQLRQINHSSWAVDRTTKTIFANTGGHSGGGKEAFIAVRWQLTGETLGAEEIWRYEQELDGSDCSPVFADGRVYLVEKNGLHVFDAATGRLLSKGTRVSLANSLVTDGQHLYALSSGESKWGKLTLAHLTVLTLGDHPREVVRSEIPWRQHQGSELELVRSVNASDNWQVLCRNVPFLAEGRLYFRTNNALTCIAE